ncbi:hypothetical protein G9P44_005598 [Scheffersomyces stipitis]|nr:hypothetical protein G9P44_005598 [Scheffersomyces stipitis]
MKLESIKQSKAYQTANRFLSFCITQWFFILLAVFIALAHSFPSFAKEGGNIRAEYSIQYGAVAMIFLISGLSMSTTDLVKNILHWRAHFTVLTSSFLITSAIIFGIATAIKACNNPQIDNWLLVGMIVTHACPTTVSSNVVMTKKAHGNDILTLCEVFIGNVLGAFITPALVQMYLTGGWNFGNPVHQPGVKSTISDLYGNVMKQLGLSVFVPIFVGQVFLNFFPKQVKWCLTKFHSSKIGSLMLLLIMYQSFSTAFAQNAFEEVSHVSVIFLVFFNIGIYLVFTILVYLYCRPYFVKVAFEQEPNETSSTLYKLSYTIFKPFYYNRADTVSVMLCGPAKTAALGVSLISSQYGAHSLNLGKLLVPLVLYQAEQVITAQVLTTFMAKWIDSEKIAQSEDVESISPSSTEYVKEKELDISTVRSIISKNSN